MSDTPQGEGWWQASDGKWYPPQPTPPVEKKGGCAKWGLGGVIAGVVVLGGCVALIGQAADDADQEQQEREQRIAQDVEMVGCTSDDLGFMRAELRVTNNSSERSNYGIDVTFEAGDGSQIDTGFASVSALEPDQTTTVEALALTEAPGDFTCRVADITRFSDE